MSERPICHHTHVPPIAWPSPTVTPFAAEHPLFHPCPPLHNDVPKKTKWLHFECGVRTENRTPRRLTYEKWVLELSPVIALSGCPAFRSVDIGETK